MRDWELSDQDVIRFWSHVEKSGPSDCWFWLRGKDKDGYGKFSIKTNGFQRHLRAHRVSLWLATKQWGALALHSCDNPACVNQAHLRWGSQLENRCDAVTRSRTAIGHLHGRRTRPEAFSSGEEHHNAKLSDLAILEIYSLYVPREGVGELAAQFGVSTGTIRSIGTGRYPRLRTMRNFAVVG